MNSVADVWDNVLQQLKKELSETTIATWFDELEAVDIQGNVFILHCSNDFKKGYIESLFMKNIKASLHDIFSTDFEVRILDDQDYAEFQGNAPKKQSERFTSAEFTFETFVVGPSNKLAYAASVSVAEHPAQNYNPLLIYGDSGLGKTHLLYAIANVIRRNDRHAKIVYIKGDDFINEFIELIRAGRGNEFRAKYREADLLLVDDIQFVAGKEQVQNEFFHTFNTLYESGRQIVLTSDRPPSEMTLLDDRLRTRFEWGLLVDVAPPDFETRLGHREKQGRHSGHGAAGQDRRLHRGKRHRQRPPAGGHHQQDSWPIRIFWATTPMRRPSPGPSRTCSRRNNEYIPSPEAILEYISKFYSLDEAVIRGQQRIRDAVQARQIAMYLIRSMTNLSLDDIGKQFDNRDHSTVLYSIQQVEKKMKKDAAFAETVKEIKTNINSKR